MIRNFLLLTFHRFFTVPAALFLALTVGKLFIKKIRDGFEMRTSKSLNQQKTLAKGSRPFWIHCASGEFEYAKPVIRSIKQQHPNIPILVTYFTPTFKKNIEACADVDMSTPLPLDLPGPCASFVRFHKPRALLIARTDLWPELLTQCRRQNVPTLLFSATKKDLNLLSRLLSPFTCWVYSLVDQIFCVSNNDQENFKAALVRTPMTVAGDTRYDQVVHRLENARAIKENLRNNLGKTPIFVAGSTWEADEKVLIEGLKDNVSESNLGLVLIPHEPTPEHIDKLQRQLGSRGLESVRYIEATEWKANKVLVVDCVGVLAELYQWGNIAFVGGSFKGSVHSVMEPLAAGCVTLVGPDHHNNREALEFSAINLEESTKAVNVVNTASELKILVETLIEQRRFDYFRTRIKSEVEKRMGATNKVVEWLATQT